MSRPNSKKPSASTTSRSEEVDTLNASIYETVNNGVYRAGYYVNHDDLNPTRIVPAGPVQDLYAPHGREK